MSEVVYNVHFCLRSLSRLERCDAVMVKKVKMGKPFLKYANCTSSMAVSASSASTVFESLALACAVDRRIKVSRARAVTGWVRATSEFSKSCDRSFAYSSPIMSAASAESAGFRTLAISTYFLTNSGERSWSLRRLDSVLSQICSSFWLPSAPSLVWVASSEAPAWTTVTAPSVSRASRY